MVDDILNMSDDEIRQSFLDEGKDPDAEAEHMVGVVKGAKMLWALREIANPENWARQVIDETEVVMWAGDPDWCPETIAQTALSAK